MSDDRWRIIAGLDDITGGKPSPSATYLDLLQPRIATKKSPWFFQNYVALPYHQLRRFLQPGVRPCRQPQDFSRRRIDAASATAPATVLFDRPLAGAAARRHSLGPASSSACRRASASCATPRCSCSTSPLSNLERPAAARRCGPRSMSCGCAQRVPTRRCSSLTTRSRGQDAWLIASFPSLGRCLNAAGRPPPSIFTCRPLKTLFVAIFPIGSPAMKLHRRGPWRLWPTASRVPPTERFDSAPAASLPRPRRPRRPHR